MRTMIVLVLLAGLLAACGGSFQERGLTPTPTAQPPPERTPEATAPPALQFDRTIRAQADNLSCQDLFAYAITPITPWAEWDTATLDHVRAERLPAAVEEYRTATGRTSLRFHWDGVRRRTITRTWRTAEEQARMIPRDESAALYAAYQAEVERVIATIREIGCRVAYDER